MRCHETGISLALCTDGLTDNVNCEDEMLGVDGLMDIVHDASDLLLGKM
jgi:hypothetical protein